MEREKQPRGRCLPVSEDSACSVIQRGSNSERRSGLTLIEMVVYTAILAVLGVPLVSAVLVSTRAMAEGDAFNRLAERNRVLLSRVGQEVRTAIATSPVIANGGLELTVTQVAGVNGTAIVPGSRVRFELLPARGESVNGVDDNKDGLVDEGRLVRRDLGSGEVVTLAEEINLASSGFSLNGQAVTIAITNFGRLRRADDVFEIARAVTVNPRN